MGLSCSTQNLVLRPGIEPRSPALGAQSLSHWTTREVPLLIYLSCLSFFNPHCLTSGPPFTPGWGLHWPPPQPSSSPLPPRPPLLVYLTHRDFFFFFFKVLTMSLLCLQLFPCLSSKPGLKDASKTPLCQFACLKLGHILLGHLYCYCQPTLTLSM